MKNEKRPPIVNRPTVFIVDGDYSVRKELERRINSAGYHLKSFASAEEFLRQEMNAEAACLVLEVNLPGLDGVSLQNLLLQRGVLLPVIFMTKHAGIQTAVRVLQSGAISFLLKPVDKDKLINEIENAFVIWHDEFRQRSEIVNIQRCYSSLTMREREIFSFIVKREFDQQNMSKAGTVEEEIETHRNSVLNKMHAESGAELALMAQKLNAASHHSRSQSMRNGTLRQPKRYPPALFNQDRMARCHPES